jgi:hypothetical protein
MFMVARTFRPARVATVQTLFTRVESMLDSRNFDVFVLGLILGLALVTTRTAYFRATLHKPVAASKTGIKRWVFATWNDSSMLTRRQTLLHLEIAKNIIEQVQLPAEIEGA